MPLHCRSVVWKEVVLTLVRPVLMGSLVSSKSVWRRSIMDCMDLHGSSFELCIGMGMAAGIDEIGRQDSKSRSQSDMYIFPPTAQAPTSSLLLTKIYQHCGTTWTSSKHSPGTSWLSIAAEKNHNQLTPSPEIPIYFLTNCTDCLIFLAISYLSSQNPLLPPKSPASSRRFSKTFPVDLTKFYITYLVLTYSAHFLIDNATKTIVT
jgi:hypothetical protein